MGGRLHPLSSPHDLTMELGLFDHTEKGFPIQFYKCSLTVTQRLLTKLILIPGDRGRNSRSDTNFLGRIDSKDPVAAHVGTLTLLSARGGRSVAPAKQTPAWSSVSTSSLTAAGRGLGSGQGLPGNGLCISLYHYAFFSEEGPD